MGEGASQEPLDQGNNVNIFEDIDILAEDLCLFDQLFPGCELNLIQTLVKITRIYKRRSLSKAVLGDFIELIDEILPKPHKFPPTKYKYLQIVQQLSPSGEEPIIEYSCGNCLNVYGVSDLKSCPKCNETKTAVCVTNDLESSIRHMFEFRGLASLIEKEHGRRANLRRDVIYDIHSGLVARKIEKKSIWDLMVIFNTDGFPYANSNNKQLWPIFLSISDIQPSLRPKFMLLASLWFSPVKPNLIKYVTPFAQKMANLESKGFNWTHPITKETVTSRVYVVSSTMDSQARPPVTNTNYFSAESGCDFCEHPGQMMEVGKGRARVYSYYKIINGQKKRVEPILRTAERIIEQAEFVFGDEEKRKREEAGIPHPEHEKGIKGYSPFMLLANFDIVNSVSTDYLHSGLIGITKRWIKNIISSKNHSKPFYVGKMKNVINSRIAKLKVPSFVTRLPRSLDLLAFWKASEYRNFLFFYSLPCLYKILPVKYFDHHCLLVESIYTLNKSEIFPSDLRRAKNLITKYCSEYGDLYGLEEETFNVHLLNHYYSCVINSGPLWATSTFQFESQNGIMRTSIHGTMNVAQELVATSKIHCALYTMEYISEIETIRYGDRIIFLGAHQSIQAISNVEVLQYLPKIAKEYNENSNTFKFYERVRINGIIYTTESYSRATKTCTHYLVTGGSGPDVKLKCMYFLLCGNNQLVIGKRVILNEPKFVTQSGDAVNHLKPFVVTKTILHEKLNIVKSPLVNIFDMLAEPPNLHEINL